MLIVLSAVAKRLNFLKLLPPLALQTVSVRVRPAVCNGCKKNPDIICRPAWKMNAFIWSAEKCVCSSDMSTLSSQVPSCISCQMPAFLQRWNRPNLLCLLSRVSRTPFTTTPSDIFSPTNLPSSVFQITLLCLTQWLKTQQESRVRLARLCGDCNMTSPSHRPEDSCGPYRMINGRLCVGGAAVCRVLRQT